jgi:hypothetical protein
MSSGAGRGLSLGLDVPVPRPLLGWSAKSPQGSKIKIYADQALNNSTPHVLKQVGQSVEVTESIYKQKSHTIHAAASASTETLAGGRRRWFIVWPATHRSVNAI